MSAFTFNCPHCEQELEATEDIMGQKMACPACNGHIELPDPVAPDPVKKVVVQTQATQTEEATTAPTPQAEVKTNVKQGALIGAIVCFLLAVGFVFFSLLTFFIYSPLFLAAFVLSIVAMAQKRVAGGLTMLLLTIIVPPILIFSLGAIRGKSALEEAGVDFEEMASEFEQMGDDMEKATAEMQKAARELERPTP
jgi:hypothetical protein